MVIVLLEVTPLLEAVTEVAGLDRLAVLVAEVVTPQLELVYLAKVIMALLSAAVTEVAGAEKVEQGRVRAAGPALLIVGLDQV